MSRRNSESTGMPHRARTFLNQEQWAMEIGSLPTFRGAGLKVSRVLYLAFRGFVQDRCSSRASALTYITILSVVPLLAFAFSLAKGFGADDILRKEVIEPFLEQYSTTEEPSLASGEATTEIAAAPDNDAGTLLNEAADTILGFVERTNVSSLGIFGLLVLVFTVIKLLGAIEQAFNDIWGIPRPRAFVRKLSDYLSITITVPILLIVATGLKSSDVWLFLRDELHLGPLVQYGLSFGSHVAVWVGFSLMYLFLPNTRVSWRAALIGGIVGGTLWRVAQMLYIKLQVGVANYNAIYAGFAALPVLLFWVYVSWLTVLLGAQIAHAFQSEPNYRQLMRYRALDQAGLERLGMRLALAAARAFRLGEPAPTLEGLSDQLGVPERALEKAADLLVDGGYLAVAQEEEVRRLLPAQDLERVRVEDLLVALEGGEPNSIGAAADSLDEVVEGLFEQRSAEMGSAPYNCTLRELVDRVPDPKQFEDGEATGSLQGLSPELS